MSNKEIVVKELTSYEEAEQVILEFKDNYFLRPITNDSYRATFINKHLENGHFLAEFNDGNPVGFFSFYSNDTESKVAFITSLALSEDLGFLKGKTLMRLVNNGIKLIRESGMEIVRLEVERDNEKGIKLYKHFGFHFIESDKENTYYMEMNLADYKY